MIEPTPPLTRVDVRPEHTLDDYAAVAHLAAAAAELRAEAARIVPRLAGRTVWIVSSTATGGGVAEMLPPIVGLLRDLGISTEWMVIGSIGAVMRASGGEQCTGKEKQPELFLS